jgi:hypothetical protein
MRQARRYQKVSVQSRYLPYCPENQKLIFAHIDMSNIEYVDQMLSPPKSSHIFLLKLMAVSGANSSPTRCSPGELKDVTLRVPPGVLGAT